MTKFEDRLLSQLMTEHGHELRATGQPSRARRSLRRPAWLGAGAIGVAGAVTAAVLTLGSVPASAAYSVAQQHGMVTVSVSRSSGVAGANAALRHLGARIVVVPVRPGCRPIRSLPRPHPAIHPSVTTSARAGRHGRHIVTVKIKKGAIPRGDTMILAFSHSHGISYGIGGIIAGHAPRCVSVSHRH